MTKTCLENSVLKINIREREREREREKGGRRILFAYDRKVICGLPWKARRNYPLKWLKLVNF